MSIQLFTGQCRNTSTLISLEGSHYSSTLTRSEMFISYIYLQVTNIHRLKCSSLDPFSTGHFLATAGDKVIKIWDYHMRMDLNFQVNIIVLTKLQCTSFSICLCESRGPPVFAEYIGRPPT